MNARFTIPYLAGLGVILIVIGWPVWSTFSLFHSFDNLEQNAKQVISGTELQEWATRLLANSPPNMRLYTSELGTNFPAQLLKLYHNPPYIQIQQIDTNSPAWVFMSWGGGMIGHCGFEIGPTNFVSYRKYARAWQPGVWFWSDSPPK